MSSSSRATNAAGTAEHSQVHPPVSGSLAASYNSTSAEQPMGNRSLGNNQRTTNNGSSAFHVPASRAPAVFPQQPNAALAGLGVTPEMTQALLAAQLTGVQTSMTAAPLSQPNAAGQQQLDLLAVARSFGLGTNVALPPPAPLSNSPPLPPNALGPLAMLLEGHLQNQAQLNQTSLNQNTLNALLQQQGIPINGLLPQPSGNPTMRSPAEEKPPPQTALPVPTGTESPTTGISNVGNDITRAEISTSSANHRVDQTEPGHVGTIILPCRARGMPVDHNFRTGHFVIPGDVRHGEDLICSYTACRNVGIKFRYCASCRIPVAKRNFHQRHSHGLEVSRATRPPTPLVSQGSTVMSPMMEGGDPTSGSSTLMCQTINTRSDQPETQADNNEVLQTSPQQQLEQNGLKEDKWKRKISFHRQLRWAALLKRRPEVDSSDQMSAWLLEVMTVSDLNSPLAQKDKGTLELPFVLRPSDYSTITTTREGGVASSVTSSRETSSDLSSGDDDYPGESPSPEAKRPDQTLENSFGKRDAHAGDGGNPSSVAKKASNVHHRAQMRLPKKKRRRFEELSASASKPTRG